jgi:hypothetical protein
VPEGATDAVFDRGNETSTREAGVHDAALEASDANSSCTDADPCVVTLASATGIACGMVVDGANVYLITSGVSSGTVVRLPIDGGPVVTLASSLQNPACDIAIDSTFVYWDSYRSDGGGVFKVPKVPIDGGLPTSVASSLSAGERPNGGGLAVAGSSVYWTTASTVMKGDLSSGASTTLASGQADPGSILVDSRNMYWLSDRSGYGSIFSLPLDGGSMATLASGVENATVLAIGGTNIFWANQSTGVVEVGLDGGLGPTPASGDSVPGMTGDETAVYWTTDHQGLGNVMKADITSGVHGQAITLEMGVNQPTAVAVDSTSVYWVTVSTNSGSVMKRTPK